MKIGSQVFFHKEFVKALKKPLTKSLFSSERRLDDGGVIDRYYRTGEKLCCHPT